jgi:hypothetical protein
MDNSGRVDMLDGEHDGSNEVGGIGLVVVSLGADAIKELAASTEVEHEVEVVCSLEVVVEGDNVAVATRHLFQDGDLIADLRGY